MNFILSGFLPEERICDESDVRRSHSAPVVKVCVVSDSHDPAAMLAGAVAAAKTGGAEAMIDCGDVIGANTLRPLLELGVPTHVVHGNNIGDVPALYALCASSAGLLTYHGQDALLELAGRRVAATHYPHYGRALACTGDYDVVFCGHSHEAKGSPTSPAARRGSPTRAPWQGSARRPPECSRT